MSRRSLALALVAAFLVPTLLLAWIGLGSLRQETQRVAERYRAQAQAIGESVESELGRVLADLQVRRMRGALDPLTLRLSPEGAWLGETLADSSVGVSDDPELAAQLAGEIDRLQARGELDLANERLAEIASKSASPDIAAWALDTRAAFLDQLGRANEAQAVRRDLLARYSTQRNSRGLLRSFAARLAMIETEPDPPAARVALYADIANQYSSLDETATAEFQRQLRAELGKSIESSDQRHRPALEQADRADAIRARLRIWLRSSKHGATDWVARGAPGGSAVFAAVSSPIPSANPLSMEAPLDPSRAGDGEFVIALERAGDEWKGGLLELDHVFAHALDVSQQDAAVRSLGFVTTIERRSESGAPAVARLELRNPFRDYALAVRGGDMAGFAAGERRRFALIAGLVGLTIATALIGAWLTLRGVAREVEAARGRQEFVAAVTHELKTPLAAIRLFAEMLESGGVEPAKVREFGARTVQEADRLARLVDSVLDLARIEHGGSIAATARVDLRRIAGGAIAIVEGYARERGFEIALSEGSGEVDVQGDNDALTRALVNLLDNAIKYGDEAHTIEIEVSRRADGFAEVAVLDRGRGVPEAERERIFEAFRRVGSELTRDRPGAGLGLALVAKIAAAHGGRATCEAREGGGSRFALILPIAREAAP